ncbi:unnamed protein product, partial [Staurois parvus]
TRLSDFLCCIPFHICHPSLPIPPLASHSVSSTPLCQSLHWPPFSVLHPSLPIPPLASHSVSSTPLCQSLHWPPSVCPPSLSANPSTTGFPFSVLHPLCQSSTGFPFSVLHPSLPIPPLASIQCPPSLSANPSTGFPISVLQSLSANPSTASH